MLGDDLELVEDSCPPAPFHSSQLNFEDRMDFGTADLKQAYGNLLLLKIRISEIFHSPCGTLAMLTCILKAANIVLCNCVSQNILGYCSNKSIDG